MEIPPSPYAGKENRRPWRLKLVRTVFATAIRGCRRGAVREQVLRQEASQNQALTLENGQAVFRFHEAV